MSSDINNVIMVARLVRDPELKSTPNGTSVARVSVANSYSYKTAGEKKEVVSYFDLVFWGKAAEIISQYGEKGKQIALEGRIGQQRWQDADGKNRSSVEITVNNFQFLGSKKSEESPSDKPGSTVQPDFPDFDDLPAF